MLTANANFLDLMGYTEAEVIGQRHSMFVDPAEARSKDYEEFWASLHQGIFVGREFRRLAKGGREVWLRANDNPVLNSRGKPEQVIKLAADVTAIENNSAADASTIGAIERSMAVIELDPHG